MRRWFSGKKHPWLIALINLEVVWVVAKLSVQVISDQYKGLTEVFILLLFFSIKKTHTESMWERERERERELIWGWAGPKLGWFSSFFFLENWIVTIRDDIFEP